MVKIHFVNCVVWLVCTSILEEHTASILRTAVTVKHSFHIMLEFTYYRVS